jgi:hypothetical protein
VVQRDRQRERAPLICARLVSDVEHGAPVGVETPEPSNVRGREEEERVT